MWTPRDEEKVDNKRSNDLKKSFGYNSKNYFNVEREGE
jgi:hypothetical protein